MNFTLIELGPNKDNRVRSPKHSFDTATSTTRPHHVSEDLVDLVREVQRTIDSQKVNEMVKYLEEALAGGKYADWAELDVVTAAKPDITQWTEKHSIYFPSSAEYFITDGQHRFCALMDFARSYPSYANKFHNLFRFQFFYMTG